MKAPDLAWRPEAWCSRRSCRPLFVEALLKLPMFLSAGLVPAVAFQGEVGAVVELPRSLGDLVPAPLMLKKQRPGLRRVPFRLMLFWTSRGLCSVVGGRLLIGVPPRSSFGIVLPGADTVLLGAGFAPCVTWDGGVGAVTAIAGFLGVQLGMSRFGFSSGDHGQGRFENALFVDLR